jgi:hypothetical protein
VNHYARKRSGPPDEITDAWVPTAAPTGTGFRWSRAAGWLRFEKPPHEERTALLRLVVRRLDDDGEPSPLVVLSG